MAQFDVFRNPSTTTRKHYPYLVDIQSTYLDELATRIVIPLGKASLFKNTPMKGLTPEVIFHDEALLLLTPQISSISKKQLKEPIGSISHLRDELTNALDFAIFGISRQAKRRLVRSGVCAIMAKPCAKSRAVPGVRVSAANALSALLCASCNCTIIRTYVTENLPWTPLPTLKPEANWRTLWKKCAMTTRQ